MNDFIEAVSRNNISMVDFLLQNKMANVNHNDGEALNIVCDANDLKPAKKTASGIKAPLDKGAAFVSPEPRLQALLEAHNVQ